MNCKLCIYRDGWRICFAVFFVACLHATDISVSIPGGGCTISPPSGWTIAPAVHLVFRGPITGNRTEDAPRMAITCAEAGVDSTADSLRDGIRRVADGCEILNDDSVPLGGRTWRRIRSRFAAGPLAFGQIAWISSVDGRTIVVVLSAPDDAIVAHLGPAAAAVGSIRAER